MGMTESELSLDMVLPRSKVRERRRGGGRSERSRKAVQALCLCPLPFSHFLPLPPTGPQGAGAAEGRRHL